MPVIDPSEIITDQFPAAPYNFDVPPPGSTIGPIKALATQAGLGIAQFSANIMLWQAQVSVQNAAGPYLDAHGVIYGVQRYPGELDDVYQPRILAAVNFGRLTTIAIAAAVLAYLISKNPSAPSPPIVQVYDKQTDPVDAAAVGLLDCQFVVDIAYPVAASKIFWAGRSYVGRNAFAINPNTVIVTQNPTDTNLVAVVNRNKAAAFRPIYRLHRYIVPHT